MNPLAISHVTALRADPYPTPDYRVLRGADDVYQYLTNPNQHTPGLIANDTEFVNASDPYCLTISNQPGTGGLIYRHDQSALDCFVNEMNNGYDPPLHELSPQQDWGNQKPYHLLFHNYLADVGPYESMGIPIHHFTDTYIRAYNLCLGGGNDDAESGGGRGLLSLKVLAFRHCNMTMRSFKDTVYPWSKLHVKSWLDTAVSTFEPTAPVRMCANCQCPITNHEVRGKIRLAHSGPCLTCPHCKRSKIAKPGPQSQSDKLQSLLHRKCRGLLTKLNAEPSPLSLSSSLITGELPVDVYDDDEYEGVEAGAVEVESQVVDPWRLMKKWHEHDHRMLGEVLGECPQARIDHVPEEYLLPYACRDADATLRLYLALKDYNPWVFWD